MPYYGCNDEVRMASLREITKYFRGNPKKRCRVKHGMTTKMDCHADKSARRDEVQASSLQEITKYFRGNPKKDAVASTE